MAELLRGATRETIPYAENIILNHLLLHAASTLFFHYERIVSRGDVIVTGYVQRSCSRHRNTKYLSRHR